MTYCLEIAAGWWSPNWNWALCISRPMAVWRRSPSEWTSRCTLQCGSRDCSHRSHNFLRVICRMHRSSKRKYHFAKTGELRPRLLILQMINWCALICFQYSIALLIFFLLELTLAIVCFVFPQKVEGIISSYLTDNVIKKYREDADLQNLIDFVQQEVMYSFYKLCPCIWHNFSSFALQKVLWTKLLTLHMITARRKSSRM